MMYTHSSSAQEPKEKVESPKTTEEEGGPVMFKFEPDFESQNKKRKAEIAHTKSIIDSLDVSERRRLKLLRDLYKNGVSKRLKKVLLAENTFEDIEE